MIAVERGSDNPRAWWRGGSATLAQPGRVPASAPRLASASFASASSAPAVPGVLGAGPEVLPGAVPGGAATGVALRTPSPSHHRWKRA